MSSQTIASRNDPYAGDAADLPLTTRVARNVAVAIVGANISYLQVGEYLDVVPSAFTRRVHLENQWRVSELDALGHLLGVAPCTWTAESTASIARGMAEKRATIRDCFTLNPNPDKETLGRWLTLVYSADYANLVLGTDD